MKVFIIILNFNGKDDTLACIESVEKLEVGSETLEVIIVDNGSSQRLMINDEGLKIIRNEKNLGYAGGNNIGITYALAHGADYILVLNNDTIVDKNLVSELLITARSNEKIGIVAPKIYFAKGYEFHKDRYKESERGKVFWYAGGKMDFANVLGSHRGVDEVDSGQYEKEEETDFASGCCMLVKREVFEKVGGGFDEKYFLYYEDNDLSQKAKRNGFKIVYSPKAVLWHKNAGSVGGSGSTLQDYYITRNRLLFGMRYAPLRAKVALMRESLRLLSSGRRWQKQGVVDFYLERFGKGTYE